MRRRSKVKWKYSSPCIIYLGIKLRWMVIFNSRPLYSRARALGIHWVESWLGHTADHCVEDQNRLPLPKIESRYLDNPAGSVSTEISRLLLWTCIGLPEDEERLRHGWLRSQWGCRYEGEQKWGNDLCSGLNPPRGLILEAEVSRCEGSRDI
jgi:hypothetical protein